MYNFPKVNFSFFLFLMRILQNFVIALMLAFFSFGISDAAFFDNFLNNDSPSIRYCNDGDCGIDEGISAVEGGLDGIETERTLAQYIQDVVIYLLGFVSIVAVIYIIYAGFRIMVGNGDEEQLKKSQKMIIYVALGIIIMWLAWPITKFILDLF